MSARGRKTEDRRQRFCRGLAAPIQPPARSANKSLSSVFCPPSSERGFTLIEMVIVIVVVALLATTFANRVWFYQEQAEKAAMVEVAGVIQSALVMRYGQLMIHEAGSEIAALATDNPMAWLAKAPRNYVGEFYDPLPSAVTPGNWAFDLESRELIYVIKRADNFVPGADGQNWIRYRVKLMYEPASGSSARATKVLVGTLFEPVVPYRWFE